MSGQDSNSPDTESKTLISDISSELDVDPIPTPTLPSTFSSPQLEPSSQTVSLISSLNESIRGMGYKDIISASSPNLNLISHLISDVLGLTERCAADEKRGQAHELKIREISSLKHELTRRKKQISILTQKNITFQKVFLRSKRELDYIKKELSQKKEYIKNLKSKNIKNDDSIRLINNDLSKSGRKERTASKEVNMGQAKRDQYLALRRKVRLGLDCLGEYKKMYDSVCRLRAECACIVNDTEKMRFVVSMSVRSLVEKCDKMAREAAQRSKMGRLLDAANEYEGLYEYVVRTKSGDRKREALGESRVEELDGLDRSNRVIVRRIEREFL